MWKKNMYMKNEMMIWGFRKFPLDDGKKEEGWVRVLGF